MNNVFEPNGLLSKFFANYEYREGQLRMAELVKKAIETATPAVIEGATGVGKSFGYLIPIILEGKSAIISTSNKSLQDQLSQKDLPTLKEIFKDVDFTWEVLKGKNNYFCHEHFKTNEADVIAGLGRVETQKLVDWAKDSVDGDVEFYPYDLPADVRDLITCDADTTHVKDSEEYDLCFACQARERARHTQIVLVNHTLLALDTSLRKESDGHASILPDVDAIVIDEAHTFEEYANRAFSDEISIFSLLHLLNWRPVKDSLTASRIRKLTNDFREAVDRYTPEKGERGYFVQTRFRKLAGFEEIVKQIETLMEAVKSNSDWQKDEGGVRKVGEVVKEAKNLIKRINAMGEDDDNMLRWAEAYENSRGITVKLKSCPLDISGILSDTLFLNTVICTSATLSVNETFDFFKETLGVPDNALELVVPSPFDYKKNALVYVSDGSVDKLWEMQKLLEYSKGRAFVLFTSYKDMKYFYDCVDVPYPKFIQREGISRQTLLEEFKNTDNAILFATKSFWEGVDIRGDKLLMVIIHKIPFGNPYDLLYSSKTERIDNKHGKGAHWTKFTIPDACLKLKQGTGRLIRSGSDVGVVALLDARVNYKNYRNAVLRAMPPALRTQRMENVEKFYKDKGK